MYVYLKKGGAEIKSTTNLLMWCIWSFSELGGTYAAKYCKSEIGQVCDDFNATILPHKAEADCMLNGFSM